MANAIYLLEETTGLFRVDCFLSASPIVSVNLSVVFAAASEHGRADEVKQNPSRLQVMTPNASHVIASLGKWSFNSYKGNAKA